jgi:hypothetical protein
VSITERVIDTTPEHGDTSASCGGPAADNHRHKEPLMTNLDSMIEKYVSSWNEPDPEARRRVIDEVWTADGVYRNATTEFAGRAGIEAAVTQAYDAFSAKGYVFKLAAVDRNHDAIRYRWEMVPATGGQADSIGTHVAIVGSNGRLVSDHQFIDTPPSAR